MKRADEPPLGLIAVTGTGEIPTPETARRDASTTGVETADTRRLSNLDKVGRRCTGFDHRPTSYRLTPSGKDDFSAWERP